MDMVFNSNLDDSSDSKFQKSLQYFKNDEYQRHNHRRLEHLASLGLDLRNLTVLEVGAGIGDHTSFFLDRQCHVTSVEAREENLKLLQLRYPNLNSKQFDLDNPEFIFEQTFDVVYCYGLLYHLKKPAEAIEFMAACCNMLLLETCVSYGEEEAINYCNESTSEPTQSYWGQGCKPTRKWVYNQLHHWFRFVYMPTTQPHHEEFPTDWSCEPPPSNQLTRSIFIASKQELYNPQLVQGILMKQFRH